MRFLAVLELYKQGLIDLDQASSLRRHRDPLAGPTTQASVIGRPTGADLAVVDAYEG